MWQLTLIYLLALEAIFVTLAATHVFGWRPPLVVAVCSPIMAYLTQSRSPVEVSTVGVSLSVITVSIEVPWSNVEGIAPKWTGAQLLLREAQEFGRRETSTIRLVGFDILWRRRRTVRAVQAWLAIHDTASDTERPS